ncbi:MAG: YceD family protein [Streptosporangiaceae bacterium]
MSYDVKNTATRLDPRASLVLDTRALGHRPGAMRTASRTVAAPAALAIEMVGVPEGADVELGLRLESVMEGVLVSGTARVPLAGECARCLDPVVSSLEVEFQELYAYEGAAAVEEDEHRVEGDLLDLEPALRDAVVLALPLSPLCRDDCPGLCSECGVRLADAGPDHVHEEAVDPRWAGLRDLVQQPGSDDGTGVHTSDTDDDQEG